MRGSKGEPENSEAMILWRTEVDRENRKGNRQWVRKNRSKGKALPKTKSLASKKTSAVKNLLRGKKGWHYNAQAMTQNNTSHKKGEVFLKTENLSAKLNFTIRKTKTSKTTNLHGSI